MVNERLCSCSCSVSLTVFALATLFASVFSVIAIVVFVFEWVRVLSVVAVFEVTAKGVCVVCQAYVCVLFVSASV